MECPGLTGLWLSCYPATSTPSATLPKGEADFVAQIIGALLIYLVIVSVISLTMVVVALTKH